MKCRQGPDLKMNFWHKVDLLENPVNQRLSWQLCHSSLRHVKTPSILLIGRVDGIYVGPGLRRNGGNARNGAEKDAMQYM